MNRPWHRRAQPLLGTIVEIAVPAADDAEARRWTDAAFDRVRAFHAAMSFHDPLSDVAAIARATVGQTLALQRCTFDVLSLALELEAASDGVFNVAVADELIGRGRLPGYSTVQASKAAYRQPSAVRSIRLHAESCSATIVEPVAIDLGGIAKGAAVDAAIHVLKSIGAPAALVNAGGDLATFGSTRHAIAVRQPGACAELLHVGYLQEGAFATTAPPLDAGESPLVSPLVTPHGRVGHWADRSVSVMAASCMMADAATKIVALMGLEAAALLGRYGCTAFSLNDRGEIERYPDVLSTVS